MHLFVILEENEGRKVAIYLFLNKTRYAPRPLGSKKQNRMHPNPKLLGNGWNKSAQNLGGFEGDLPLLCLNNSVLLLLFC